MSGYTEHPAVKTSAIGPHEHFIAKPFTSHELANAIDRTARRPSRLLDWARVPLAVPDRVGGDLRLRVLGGRVRCHRR